MIARTEGRDDLPALLRIPVLSMVVGFVAVYGLVVDGLLSLKTFWGPRGWQTSGVLAMNLFIVGAIWGLSRVQPSRQKSAALSLLLTFAAVLGFGAIAAIVTNMRATDFQGLWSWKTQGLIAANLLVCAGAIWGLLRLKPWKALKAADEPESPSTRRTKNLFGLSGLIGTLGALALMIGTFDKGNPVGLFSNSPVSPGIAIFAIASWLLSNGIAWWWYYSADEHERRANDVGFLAGGGLFLTATPVWWVGARAGLLPPPDAMVLWFAMVVAMTVGWAWYRNR